ncbi:hypothetical protein [Sphingobacterium hungaricum]|uniref:Uncharacterized protein n=1 Tax=Sphingobacterium hungaricum TaxID=2082723 RepID=A0A928YP84_9SPHI|nr:hypothetical protein [Sphingobacterium hungaricum]MBE8712679.1 hypothetical protein [Sphingobacterium hungaricum]
MKYYLIIAFLFLSANAYSQNVDESTFEKAINQCNLFILNEKKIPIKENNFKIMLVGNYLDSVSILNGRSVNIGTGDVRFLNIKIESSDPAYVRADSLKIFKNLEFLSKEPDTVFESFNFINTSGLTFEVFKISKTKKGYSGLSDFFLTKKNNIFFYFYFYGDNLVEQKKNIIKILETYLNCVSIISV